MALRRALYDLRHRAASFDFFTWQANVLAKGVDEIVFWSRPPYGKSKWSELEIAERFETIVKPAPALAGLPWRHADPAKDGDETINGFDFGSHRLGDLIALGNNDFHRVTAVKPAASARYTVTLRKTKDKTWRNSDDALWRQFAKEIGAFVIEDYFDKPIHLHDRMSLYAGATMNFGVTNGPMAMLFFSPYPVMQFDCGAYKDGLARHGVECGAQLPWFLPGQSMVWEKPTMDLLMKSVKSCL